MSAASNKTLVAPVLLAVLLSAALRSRFWFPWSLAIVGVVLSLPAFWFARNPDGTYWYARRAHLARAGVVAVSTGCIVSLIVLWIWGVSFIQHGSTMESWSLFFLLYVADLGTAGTVLWQCGARSRIPLSADESVVLRFSYRSRSLQMALGAGFVVLLAAFWLWVANTPDNAHMGICFVLFGIVGTAMVMGVIAPSWSDVVITKNAITWDTFFPRGRTKVELSQIEVFEYFAGMDDDAAYLVLRTGEQKRLPLFREQQRRLAEHFTAQTSVKVRAPS